MSEAEKPKAGSINWVDLTVDHADDVMEFYRKVVGWESAKFDMGGYNDYCMSQPEDGKTVAGVCHARGTNAGIPPVWLVYINVADLDASIASCNELGGSILAGPKNMGSEGRYCIMRDPAGAVAALYQPTAK